MEKNNILYSITLKLIAIVFALMGFTLAYLNGHVNGITNLLYFTNQSNLWIAAMDVVLIAFMIKALISKNYKLNDVLYKIQQVFVTCITITGLVFILVLAPGYFLSKDKIPGYSPFNLASVSLHIVVPTISILDYLLFVKNVEFKKYSELFILIPTIYYFIFSLIGYLLKWDFGDGRNYPYFFINYDSPAGIFGFSSTLPYFMGSFYWIILLMIFAVGLSYFYIWIIKRKNRRS